MVLKQAKNQAENQNEPVWQAHELRQNLLFCQGILQDAVQQKRPLHEKREIVQECLKWKSRLQEILS